MWMPGRFFANSLAPMWMSRLVEVAGREPADGVGADRVERHVAEVEQAGEADHDVEPERHDHVGQHEREVLDPRVAGVEEQRQDQGEER